MQGLDKGGESRYTLSTPFHFSHLKGTAPGDRVLTQQRRLRLGDILDDYCPRERRITNHAVVAMIEDAVKQVRCTTCDADHEYKQGKVPAARRKKLEGGAAGDTPDALLRARAAAESHPDDEGAGAEEAAEEQITEEAAAEAGVDVPESAAPAEAVDAFDGADPDAPEASAGAQDDGPVHRRLIRATLPRPDGQVPQPERKAPDFTVRQPGGRGGGRGEFDGNRNGQRAAGGGGRPMRFGGARPGSGSGQGQGQGPRHGSGPRPGGSNRPGQGQRGGGRPGPGGAPGQGRSGGGGRKRGR